MRPGDVLACRRSFHGSYRQLSVSCQLSDELHAPIFRRPARMVEVAHARMRASDLVRRKRHVEQFVHVLSDHHVAVDEDEALKADAVSTCRRRSERRRAKTG